MYKSPRETQEFLRELFKLVSPQLRETPHSELSKNMNEPRVVVLPSVLSLWVAQEMLRNSGIGLGAQNFFPKKEGAFTGETSVNVLSEIGVQYALVGHSERRSLFHETDELISQKVAAAQDHNLIPIFCFGESLNERQTGVTFKVIQEQLESGLKNAHFDKEIILAYEPVWAIGTGQTATSSQANEVHQFVRQYLARVYGADRAAQTTILYGGSVKPENASELAQQSDIDGFLVGGASLIPESFHKLIHSKHKI